MVYKFHYYCYDIIIQNMLFIFMTFLHVNYSIYFLLMKKVETELIKTPVKDTTKYHILWIKADSL